MRSWPRCYIEADLDPCTGSERSHRSGTWADQGPLSTSSLRPLEHPSWLKATGQPETSHHTKVAMAQSQEAFPPFASTEEL